MAVAGEGAPRLGTGLWGSLARAGGRLFLAAGLSDHRDGRSPVRASAPGRRESRSQGPAGPARQQRRQVAAGGGTFMTEVLGAQGG